MNLPQYKERYTVRDIPIDGYGCAVISTGAIDAGLKRRASLVVKVLCA